MEMSNGIRTKKATYMLMTSIWKLALNIHRFVRQITRHVYLQTAVHYVQKIRHEWRRLLCIIIDPNGAHLMNVGCSQVALKHAVCLLNKLPSFLIHFTHFILSPNSFLLCTHLNIVCSIISKWYHNIATLLPPPPFCRYSLTNIRFHLWTNTISHYWGLIAQVPIVVCNTASSDVTSVSCFLLKILF